MKILLNGENREFADGTTIDELLDAENIRRDYMAVERNQKVVRKHDFATTVLFEGDVIEIVKLVGGG
jgi:thiamine biosynthesis protein ThiS